VVQQQEIKDRATVSPRTTVPAVPTGKLWFIDLERRVTIPPISVMPTKRTTAHATTIKLNIATNERKRIWRALEQAACSRQRIGCDDPLCVATTHSVRALLQIRRRGVGLKGRTSVYSQAFWTKNHSSVRKRPALSWQKVRRCDAATPRLQIIEGSQREEGLFFSAFQHIIIHN
jgi:hypothetical protein